MEIALVDDVVAIKNRPRFVAADRHGYSLWNPMPNHIANSRPSKVMENQPRVVELFVLESPSAMDTRHVSLFVALGWMVAERADHLAQTSRGTNSRPTSTKVFNWLS